MGILHHRNVRYVDSKVKNDKKLLMWVRMHPILYDKTHQFHRDRKEKSKTWENIAKILNHPSGTKCKTRWLELVKKYNEMDSRWTMHEPIIEKLDQLLKKDPVPNFTIDEIEDDVLSQLFSESVERQMDQAAMETTTDEDFIYHNSDIGFALELLSDDDFVPSRPIYASFSTNDISSLELFNEACSLPSSANSELLFTTSLDAGSTNHISVMDDSMDYTYQSEEDVNAYYRYFSDNYLQECDRNPYIFNNVVESLLQNTDNSLRARDDIVKLLCDNVRKNRTNSKNQ